MASTPAATTAAKRSCTAVPAPAQPVPVPPREVDTSQPAAGGRQSVQGASMGPASGASKGPAPVPAATS